jgi:hypothetical protein
VVASTEFKLVQGQDDALVSRCRKAVEVDGHYLEK